MFLLVREPSKHSMCGVIIYLHVPSNSPNVGKWTLRPYTECSDSKRDDSLGHKRSAFLFLRIQVCPLEGITPKILLSGWDWNPQSYSRNRFGFLGFRHCAWHNMFKHGDEVTHAMFREKSEMRFLGKKNQATELPTVLVGNNESCVKVKTMVVVVDFF